jgi:DHA1 family inner membrane transport protein
MTAAPAAVARRPWPIVLLFVGAGVVAAFQVGKVPMALAEIQRELGLGLSGASWLMSAFAIVGAVAGAPVGLVVDRLGARRVAVASMVVLAAGAAMGAVVTAPAAVLATRVVEGLGFVGVTVAAPALVAAAAPAQMRERAMALWATFMPVGMTVVMLAAPLLGEIGWRGFWLVNAALLAAYAGLLAWGTHGVRPSHAGPSPAILRDVAAAAGAFGPWILGGLFAAFSAAFFAAFSFLPTYLAERLQVAADTAAMLCALAVAASAAGNLLCGRLLVRGARPAHLLFASFGVMAACGVAMFQPAAADAGIVPAAIVFSLAGGRGPRGDPRQRAALRAARRPDRRHRRIRDAGQQRGAHRRPGGSWRARRCLRLAGHRPARHRLRHGGLRAGRLFRASRHRGPGRPWLKMPRHVRRNQPDRRPALVHRALHRAGPHQAQRPARADRAALRDVRRPRHGAH